MYIKKEWKSLLVVFLATFIPRLLLCINNLPLNSLPDEFSTIAAAAQYAGKDWSEIVSTTRYYGTGFTALFAPLFMLTDNPFIIYRWMMIACAIVQSLSGPICYYIMDQLLEIKDKKYTIVASIASSYMVVTYIIYVFNEHPMILCSWVLALLLILLVKYIDDKKKKAILTLLLLLVLSYSLTLHTRAITFWIAFFALLILFFWGYRKWIVSLPVAIGAGGLGYCAAQLYIKFAQSAVWTFNGDKIIAMGNQALEEGQEAYLHNAEISGLQYIKELIEPKSWPSFFNVILSQINTVTVVSVGFAIVCIVIIIALICNLVIRKKNDLSSEDQRKHQMYVAIAIFFAVCIAVSIVGMAVTWLGQAMRAYNLTSTAGYGFKAYTNIRYAGPYLGPVMMLGLAYIYQYRDKVVQLLKPCVWVYVFIQFYFVASILPYIYRQQVSSTYFVPFSLQEYGEYGDLKRMLTYLPGLVITFVIFIIMLVAIYKKRQIVIPMILSIVLLYEYSYATLNFEHNGYKWADSGYALIEQLEEKVEVPETLYVPNDAKYNMQAYVLQFLLNDYRISPSAPSEDADEAILFYNSYDPAVELDLMKKGYWCAQLDENEFIFVKGKELKQAVIDCGIKLQKRMAYTLNLDIRDFESQNNCALFDHTYLESGGREGYLLYDNEVRLCRGNYRIAIELEILSGNGNIGNCELWYRGDIWQESEVVVEQTENNNVLLTIEGQTDIRMRIEPKLWINEGVKVKVHSVVVESGF